MLAQVPMKRIKLKTEEIGRSCGFLGRSEYLAGQTITIDGGPYAIMMLTDRKSCLNIHPTKENIYMSTNRVVVTGYSGQPHQWKYQRSSGIATHGGKRGNWNQAPLQKFDASQKFQSLMLVKFQDFPFDNISLEKKIKIVWILPHWHNLCCDGSY